MFLILEYIVISLALSRFFCWNIGVYNFKEIYAWDIRVDSGKSLPHSAMDEDWRFRNRQFNCKVNSLFSSYLPFAFFPVSINS